MAHSPIAITGVMQAGYVIVPLFHRRGTGMPELLILFTVLAGGALMGVLGALIAIPAAVMAHTLFMEVLVPWRRRELSRAEADGGLLLAPPAPGRMDSS